MKIMLLNNPSPKVTDEKVYTLIRCEAEMRSGSRTAVPTVLDLDRAVDLLRGLLGREVLVSADEGRDGRFTTAVLEFVN